MFIRKMRENRHHTIPLFESVMVNIQKMETEKVKKRKDGDDGNQEIASTQSCWSNRLGQNKDGEIVRGTRTIMGRNKPGDSRNL